MLHSHSLLSRFTLIPPSRRRPPPSHLPSSPFLSPAGGGGAAAPRAAGIQSPLAELPEAATPPSPAAEEVLADGPVELPPSSTPSTLFAVDGNPTPLQVTTSVLLTGAISVFLFRSLRRRAKRAKELRMRSTGVKKTKDLKEEALDSLKAAGVVSVEAGKPPSPGQTFLGAIAAGVIAVILYKFTTTIEAALNRQTISDNFSVRQITITIRTIVNGLCYFATFVFGINSIGLMVYSVQLALGSLMENTSGKSSSPKEDNREPTVAPSKSAISNAESRSIETQESSDKN